MLIVLDETLKRHLYFLAGEFEYNPPPKKKKRPKSLCQMAKSEYDTGFGRMVETHLF